MDTLDVTGLRVTLFLKDTGYRFTGTVLSESEEFLKIESDRDGHIRFINKKAIETMEVSNASS